MCLNHSPSQREAKVGTQSRNLGTGTDAETMEDCCLLAGSQYLPELRSICLGVMLHTAGWSLPHQSGSRKCPTDTPTDKLVESFNFSFLFPGDPSLCEVDKIMLQQDEDGRRILGSSRADNRWTGVHSPLATTGKQGRSSPQPPRVCTHTQECMQTYVHMHQTCKNKAFFSSSFLAGGMWNGSQCLRNKVSVWF